MDQRDYVGPMPTQQSDFDQTAQSSSQPRLVMINQPREFTRTDAQTLLPIILRITKLCSVQIEELTERLSLVASDNEELAHTIESLANIIILGWQTKIQKLGAHPRGLWTADFDSGDGFYCWKYPEKQIEFWHRREDGFSKRSKI